jgi:hypothetical protein
MINSKFNTCIPCITISDLLQILLMPSTHPSAAVWATDEFNPGFFKASLKSFKNFKLGSSRMNLAIST